MRFTSDEYKQKTNVLDGAPYSFLNIDGREARSHNESIYNMKEAEAVTELIQSIAIQSASKDVNWSSPEKIRIITFYQAQVSTIQRLLKKKLPGGENVTVATVDSSQGSEADIVIISFVRSSDRIGSAHHTTAGFLADDRRLNVALTRAKYQLVCVGNASSLEKSGVATLEALVDNARNRNCIVNFEAYRAKEA